MKLTESTNPVQLGAILFIIVSVCVFLLAVVFSYTTPIIENNSKIAEKNKLNNIFSNCNKFVSTNNYYIGFENNKIVGFIFKESSRGYAGNIDILVGISSDGLIKGIEIIKQNETPGLGSKINETKPGEKYPYYLARYLNKNKSEFETVEVISGATISSKAVKNGIRKAYEDWSELKK